MKLKQLINYHEDISFFFRRGRFSGRHLCSIAIVFVMSVVCWSGNAATFSVTAKADDRSSLLFSEDEPVCIKALVKGGTGSVQVEYKVWETCGDWSDKGILTIPRKGGEATETKIPLSLPERGHYQLTLTAKCGNLTANDFTTAAIVYQPLPATVDSPWGIMWGVYRDLPPGFDPKDAPAYIVKNMRMLGASWTRMNFWFNTYKIEVKNGNVVLDLSSMRRQVDEFRKRGINILGEIVQTPRILSSKPNSNESKGDGGPLFCRVKPADYRLWDQMVEQIAREFKDDIQVWEVWNEVANSGHFWVGTDAEFIELLAHTAAAIRRGNPTAKIAAPGFTDSVKKCEPFFKAGLGKYIDILTVHYTDRRDRVGEFLELEEKYGLKLPIENTEESAVPSLNNLARGIRTFKFIHMLGKGLPYRPLMTFDWKLNPIAVTYSVGARLIGTKKFRRVKELPGFKVYFFGDEGDIAVITNHRGTSAARLMDSMNIDRISVKTVPAEGREVAVIDALGREKKLSGGAGEIPFSLMSSIFRQNKDMIFATPECVFIRGCKDIVSIERLDRPVAIVVEAESGNFDPKTIVISKNMNFSGSKYVNIYQKKAPGEKGYGVDLKVSVPTEGNYLVLFSGNGLSRLKKPCSISPFSWSFDDGTEQTPIGEKIKMIGNIVGDIDGAPEGISELGTVHLTKGDHIFHLRLTAPREALDNYWALWFDAIALVPKH